MSDPNGPVRRRRIAGESKPTVEPTESKRKLIPKVPKKLIAPKPAAASKPTVSLSKPAETTAEAPKVAKETKTPRSRLSLPQRSQWRWFIPLVLVAVAAVVFGVLFSVKGIADFRDGRGIDKANSQASSAAGKAAERIFTYQYNKLPEHLKGSKALMTPSFQKEFDSIAPALTELAPQRKIVVMSQSRGEAAIECGDECSPTKSSVLVFLDQARLVGDSKTPTVFGNRIVVDMVKRDGSWLVNNITAL